VSVGWSRALAKEPFFHALTAEVEDAGVSVLFLDVDAPLELSDIVERPAIGGLFGGRNCSRLVLALVALVSPRLIAIQDFEDDV
jgi:hypothetical protein